jgi:hypothetical protein
MARSCGLERQNFSAEGFRGWTRKRRANPRRLIAVRQGSEVHSLAELDRLRDSILWHDWWIEPVDQCGKFGFEALVLVMGTLAHDVAHFPIAICGLTVLAASFVHHAETSQPSGSREYRMRRFAGSYLGVFQLARVDELDHPVGGIGNLVILIVVPGLANRSARPSLRSWTSKWRAWARSWVSARSSASMTRHLVNTSARGRIYFVCNLAGGRHFHDFLLAGDQDLARQARRTGCRSEKPDRSKHVRPDCLRHHVKPRNT